MLQTSSMWLTADPPLLAAVILVVAAIVLAVGVIIHDLIEARRTRILTADDWKRDQATEERRRRLDDMQAQFRDRRRIG